MPNWTDNRLVFIGPDEQLDSLSELLRGANGVIDFNSIVPMPPILNRIISPVRTGDNGRTMLRPVGAGPLEFNSVEATPEEQFELDACPAPSWYEFATENWGSKWNAVDPEMEREDNQLTYTFQTAWDAPRAYYRALQDYIEAVMPGVSIDADAVHEDGEQHETII